MILFVLKILSFLLTLALLGYFGKFGKYIIVNLGSFYIKLGQFLSTREDLIGKKRAELLQVLQYNVDERNIDLDDNILPENLIQDLATIEKKPIKSASIALVYSGLLKNGDKIAIKIVKQNEKKGLEVDCQRFLKFCQLLSKFRLLKRFNFEKIAIDIVNSLKLELDMQNEAKNIAKFRYYNCNELMVSAPFVYEKYSTNNVLVMEFLEGFTVLDIIKSDKFDQKQKSKIAAIALNSHLKQVYIDNYFHSDPHQSNLIWSNNKLYFIDFGAYCKLKKQDATALLRIMNAFLNKNYQEIAAIHMEVKYIDDTVNLSEFEAECKKIGDQFLNNPNFTISEVFKSLIDTSKKFQMQVQPQLILVQKTMVMIEGLIKSLDPTANPLTLSKTMIDKIYFRFKVKNFIIKLKNFFKK